MKKVTFFYLEDCPYCRNARKAMDDLKQENASYKDIELDWIEESEQPEIADKYDYYSVPTFYLGEEKLYEAHFGQGYDEIRENVKRVFDAALA